MGSGSFDARAYRAYAATTSGKTTYEIYSSRSIHKNLNPKGVKIRESRDSEDNPQSTPVIVGIDVTGSMGIIADYLAREGLGILLPDILNKKPITNPHVMFMAIGDANWDNAPLQVSQFEADNRIVEQLTQIYIEQGGGGNSFESYNLPWYFAARHTEHDSLIKRGKRGYLFTVGDEEAPGDLTIEQIEEVIGDKLERKMSTKEMLKEAQRKYDVFHIMIAEGSHASMYADRVRQSWTGLLGQRAMWLTDHKKLSETIIGAILMAEGADADKVKADYGKVVYDAVKALPASKTARLALTE